MYQLYMLIGDGLYNWYGTSINEPVKLSSESKQFLERSLSIDDQNVFKKRYLQSKYRIGRMDGKLEEFFKNMFILTHLQHIVESGSYQSCDSIMIDSDYPNTAYYRKLDNLKANCDKIMRRHANIHDLQLAFIKLVNFYRVAELADVYMEVNVL